MKIRAIDGDDLYISLSELARLLGDYLYPAGTKVGVSPSGLVTGTNVQEAIAQLGTGAQRKLTFYNGGTLQGEAFEIDATSGVGLSIVGNRATLTGGATVSSQSFGSNLILPIVPDQFLNLTATSTSLTVTLQQGTADTVTHLYNAGTNPFSVIANWEGDPHFASTEVLIVGEGTIVDVSADPKAITLAGTVALSTAQAKFGTQSIRFNGAGDYLSLGTNADFNWLHDGSTPWTLEVEARFTNTTGTLFATASADTERGIRITAAGTVTVWKATAGQTVFSGSFTPPALNAWANLTFTYDPAAVGGAKLYIFVNGILVTTLSQNSAPTSGNSGSALIVGNQCTVDLDAIRATRVLRYTGNFTPATSPPPTFLRKGTYFTVPVIPGVMAAFTFDPALGWQMPYLLPNFAIRNGGVDLAQIGQIRGINFTGTALAAAFTGDTVTVTSSAIAATDRGAANGVASLDSNGLVPASQLPVSAMEFKGNWNASTNSPTLADGVGNSGDVYRVSVAGTRNLGSGSIDWAIGDWVLYNGSIWQKGDNTDSVASVFGRSGVVTPQSGDYNASQVTVTPYGNIASNTVQAAIQELDDEKQADIQWQDEGVNQGTTGQINTVNVTGAGATLSVSSGTATLNIPGAGTSPTLALTEQSSDPSSAAGQAVVFAKTDDILYYRQESNGTINQISVLGRSQTYTAAQGTAQVTLTDGATISVNAALSNSFTVTLGGNRTLANPTNTVAGFTYVFQIVQDATGSRTLAYGTNYKFPGGTVPMLSTTANAVDVLTCYCGVSGGNLNCTLMKDFK